MWKSHMEKLQKRDEADHGEGEGEKRLAIPGSPTEPSYKLAHELNTAT